jgi:ABC-type amino acid transport substrate-binding protein
VRRGVRWMVVVAVASVALSLVISAQSPTLTLLSTAWPPFTNAPGQPRFALDLVEAALGRFGFAGNTAIVSAAEFTPLLLSGRFDGSAAAWKDPEREQALVFSQPYLQNRLVLVGRTGADVAAKTLADLKGKRVAIVEGYSYGDAIDNAGPIFIRSSGEEDSLARLLAGGADYTLMDELVVQYIVSNYPSEAATRLAIGSIPLVTRDLYFTVRRARPDAESIVSRFNAQLRGMIADRTYHQLLRVDWIQADVDGDGVTEYVPRTDQVGPTEPTRAYPLFTSSQPLPLNAQPTGFYIGGSQYADWASVPSNYKLSNSDAPDPRRSGGSIFTFKW